MQVTCPACQKTLQSTVDLSGKTVKCKCGHSFTVPKAAVPAQPTAAAPAGKIAVQCSCGKTLQAPAAAAGKAVKCPCGQVVRVPAATPTTAQRASAARPVAAMATAGAAAPTRAGNPYAPPTDAPNPFGDISDEEWKSMVQANAPKKVEESKPKEKSAAAKMLDEARRESGQGDNLAMDAAKGFLNKTRGILVFLGILCMIRSVVSYWLITSFIDSAAGGEDPDVTAVIKLVVMVFCGIDLGIGVLYIVAGFMVGMFPFTCTISALVVFTLVEIAGLILDPTSLLSIRGWIFRIAIFGGLIQGINNAAYYRHLKAEEKAAKKRKP